MSKVHVLGPRRLLPDALRVLHAQGVLQIRSLPTAPAATDAQAWFRVIPLAQAERGAERRMTELADRLHQLLLMLPTPDEREEELADATAPDRVAVLETEIRVLSERRATFEAERELTARYERLLTALTPLRTALPQEARMTTVGILLRRERAEILRLLEQELARITRGAYILLSRELDREHLALLLTVPREAAPDVSRLLFERGIAEIRLPERYAGLPLIDALLVLFRRSQELPAEIEKVTAQLLTMSRRWYRPLTQALRTVRDRLARLRAMANCAESEHAFVISGWVPAEQCNGLAAVLEAAFKGPVMLVEYAVSAAEYANVPVVLRNLPYVKAFEPLVTFFALPCYGSVDPTPFIAVFFPLFFGLMLGDVGFGGLALALALLSRIKGWGGDTGRRLTTIALACSVSAIAFGLLFGELFGELGEPLRLHPLLFDRREATLSFLGLALALGVAHVVLGVGLGFWSALRHGRRWEALARAATLGVILIAFAVGLSRAGYLSDTAGRVALLALPVLLAAAILLGGALAPLELVSTFGHILSYARLMALGTASVMLADVANRMAEVFPAPIGVAAAVALHGVNIAMGLFSPTIQALRLHYVEFFDKFFEGGGRPYEPFALTT